MCKLYKEARGIHVTQANATASAKGNSLGRGIMVNQSKDATTGFVDSMGNVSTSLIPITTAACYGALRAMSNIHPLRAPQSVSQHWALRKKVLSWGLIPPFHSPPPAWLHMFTTGPNNLYQHASAERYQ